MKIICIGRNYVAHTRELGNDIPDEPVFFMKPDTSLLIDNQPFPVPEWSNDLHHEIELIIRICRVGKKIPEIEANHYFNKIGIGIDFTARDIQKKLCADGLPWEKSKAFDNAAAIGSNFIPAKLFSDLKSINFHLDINGKTVQSGNSGLMIFGFEKIISHISKYITLKPGDLIFTGTPAGVGPVKPGDHVEGYLEESKLFDFMII